MKPSNETFCRTAIHLIKQFHTSVCPWRGQSQYLSITFSLHWFLPTPLSKHTHKGKANKLKPQPCTVCVFVVHDTRQLQQTACAALLSGSLRTVVLKEPIWLESITVTEQQLPHGGKSTLPCHRSFFETARFEQKTMLVQPRQTGEVSFYNENRTWPSDLKKKEKNSCL